MRNPILQPRKQRDRVDWPQAPELVKVESGFEPRQYGSRAWRHTHLSGGLGVCKVCVELGGGMTEL